MSGLVRMLSKDGSDHMAIVRLNDISGPGEFYGIQETIEDLVNTGSVAPEIHHAAVTIEDAGEEKELTCITLDLLFEPNLSSPDLDINGRKCKVRSAVVENGKLKITLEEPNAETEV